jgi:hypothetical protein
LFPEEKLNGFVSYKETTMKKRIFTLLVLLPAIGLGVRALAQNDNDAFARAKGDRDDGFRRLVYDVACDARTFRLNKSGSLMDARRGDGFIVQGKIYPAGTIPPGGTVESPGPFDPDTAPGSIGTWICRGTFHFDISEILAGANPHLYSTQLHLFENGRGLVHEGPEGGAPQLRALTGGMGHFTGASGEVLEEPIGVNSTGLFNIRHTFKIKRNSIE